MQLMPLPPPPRLLWLLLSLRPPATDASNPSRGTAGAACLGARGRLAPAAARRPVPATIAGHGVAGACPSPRRPEHPPPTALQPPLPTSHAPQRMHS